MGKWSKKGDKNRANKEREGLVTYVNCITGSEKMFGKLGMLGHNGLCDSDNQLL